MKIHQEGSAVCGVYSFELAEQKSIEATTLSRNAGFPLQIRIEKD
jgi:ATP-dependent Clp protease adaptor protein ClpS